MSDSINATVEEMIRVACERNGQTEAVANKIIAWVSASYQRELDGGDMQEHADLVVKSINVPG